MIKIELNDGSIVEVDELVIELNNGCVYKTKNPIIE